MPCCPSANSHSSKHLAVDSYYLKSYHFTGPQLVTIWSLTISNVGRNNLGCVAINANINLVRGVQIDTTHTVTAGVTTACHITPTDCNCQDNSAISCQLVPISTGYFALGVNGALLNATQSQLGATTTAEVILSLIIDLSAITGNNANALVRACLTLMTLRLVIQATCSDCHACLKKEVCQTVTLRAGDCLLGYGSIHTSARDAVVTLIVDNGAPQMSDAGGNTYTSGFFVGPSGPIVVAADSLFFPDRQSPSAPGYYWVRVTNVNGVIGTHRIYPAQLLFVDGAGGVALLQPLSGGPNYPSPALCCQPYLTLGDNTACQPGEPVFALGGGGGELVLGVGAYPVTGDDLVSISPGVIQNPKYMVATQQQAELVTTSCRISQRPDMVGGPIVNNQCQVIGVTTSLFASNYFYLGGAPTIMPPPGFTSTPSDQSDYRAGGLSSRLLATVLARNSGGVDPILSPTLIMIPSYHYLDKGYLAITSGHVVGAADIIRDYGTTLLITYPPIPLIAQPNLQGFKIDSLDKVTGFPLYVGLAAIPEILTNVTNNHSVYITIVDGLPIGNLNDQYAIGVVTWNKRPGQTVQVSYVLPPSTLPVTVTVTLGAIPVGNDIWYG